MADATTKKKLPPGISTPNFLADMAQNPYITKGYSSEEEGLAGPNEDPRSIAQYLKRKLPFATARFFTGSQIPDPNPMTLMELIKGKR